MRKKLRTPILLILSFLALNAFGQFTVKQADSLLMDLYESDFNNRGERAILCNELVQYYKNKGDTCNQVKALARLARFEINLAELETAMATLIEAQKLFDASHCHVNPRVQILISYSALYDAINETQKGDSMAMLGLRLFDRSDPDKSSLIKLYMDAADEGKPLDECLPYLDTAYQLAVDYNKPSLRQKILISFGVAYANNGNFPEALKYMHRAVPFAIAQNRQSELSALYNNLAGLSSDPETILMYIDSALFYAYEGGNLHDIQMYTENKAYFYSTIEDFESGYYELWESMVLKDSLLNVKKLEAVADLQQKYEAEKKAKEIQTLKVEVLNSELSNLTYKRNQNKLLVGSLSLLAIAIFLIFSVINIRRHRNSLAKKNIEIDKARQRSDELLLNILPAEIAQELKDKGTAEARKFDMVSILFTDFKEFTQTSEKLSATELVGKINYCFKGFDEIMGKYGVEKIKTIGDAYMAAGGLPVHSEASVRNTVLAGLEMQRFIADRKKEIETLGEIAFEMRVGIHTGPVVAGIVGVKKFQYDVWGDTVNTASRMESNSEIGKVNISGDTFELLKNDKSFIFEYRGKIQAKGKGEIDMYFVGLKEDKT